VGANETTLINQIKGLSQMIDRKEGGLVIDLIKLARLYAELKQVTKKHRWQKVLKDLGQSPRVVGRYITIGTSWWADAPHDSAVWAKLPYDLLKLEWLCRLSEDQLTNLLEFVDCRKTGRSVLIGTVKRALGQPETDVRQAHTTATAIVKRWQDYVTRTLYAIEALTDTVAEPEVLHELAEQLEAGYADIKESLMLPEDGSDDLQDHLEGEEGDSEESAGLEEEYAEGGDAEEEEGGDEQEDLEAGPPPLA